MNALQVSFAAMAASLGIAMQNAVTNQRSGQIVATAAMTKCCELIFTRGAKPPVP